MPAISSSSWLSTAGSPGKRGLRTRYDRGDAVYFTLCGTTNQDTNHNAWTSVPTVCHPF
jgi:hypothetical protein